MNVKFYLNNPDIDKTTIMIYITFSGQRIRMSTGIDIPVNLWDAKNDKVKSSSVIAMQTNKHLQNFAAMVTNFHSGIANKDPKTIKQELQQFIKDEIQNHKDQNIVPNFMDSFMDFIKSRESNPGFSKSIIHVYRITLQRLDEFQKHNKIELDFSSFTEAFYLKFVNFLLYNGNSNNTVGKYIKTLKTFLNYAYDKGLMSSTEFKKFKVFKHESDTVALTLDEIDAIAALDLSKYSALHLSQVIFMISCYSGLRFGDIMSLRPSNVINDGKHIEFEAHKTKEQIIIPIHPKLKQWIDKFFAFEDRKIHNSLVNKNLKIIAKMAGINTPVHTRQFKGRERIDTELAKHELVSTHTGRRSFITLSLKKGVLPEAVMKISGHKDRTTFQKYVKITQTEAVDAVMNVWN